METMEICSQCGSHRSSRSNPNPPNSFPSPTNEIAYLNKERAEIDEQIRMLKQRKAHFGRRINALQSSTRVLPPETLSEIFGHICHGNDNLHSLIQILSVCFHWSQLARSTPRLWTKLFVAIYPDLNQAYKANLLQLCLMNVRGAPLTLELLMDDEWAPVGVADPFVRILAVKENAEKIRELGLWAPQHSLISVITKNCVNLEKLEITDFRQYTTIINLENQLRLHTLSLLGYFPVPPILPSIINIKTLKLDDFSTIGVCFDILAQCKHSLIDMYLSLNRDVIYPGIPITFDCLRTLRLNINDALFMCIQHLKFPALENLILDVCIHGHDVPRLEGVPQLFQSLPDIPITVRIEVSVSRFEDRFEESFTFLDCFLKNGDHVKELNILSKHPLKAIIELLCDVKVLPRLRRLLIMVSTYTINEDIWLGSLLKMLEYRRLGLMKPFYLEVLQEEDSKRMEQLSDLVTQLNKEGCSISLRYGSVRDFRFR